MYNGKMTILIEKLLLTRDFLIKSLARYVYLNIVKGPMLLYVRLKCIDSTLYTFNGKCNDVIFAGHCLVQQRR